MKLRPDVPIILATGYSREITPDKARAMGLRGYVPKPYRAADLSAALRSALHDSPATEA
jgi:two-component system cell cycle sensor histidine kinase/response regulator CckA